MDERPSLSEVSPISSLSHTVEQADASLDGQNVFGSDSYRDTDDTVHEYQIGGKHTEYDFKLVPAVELPSYPPSTQTLT